MAAVLQDRDCSDDADEIWHYGKDGVIELPLLEALPEPMLDALPESKRGVFGEKWAENELVAQDLFEAVGYWLHNVYGSAVFEVTVEVAVKPIGKSECAQAGGLAASITCEASPSKRPEAHEVANPILSPRPSPNKRYRCKDPELLQPGTTKRNYKLCQAEGCIFSTGQPGQPARAMHAQFCMWCDPEAMKAELQLKAGRAKICKALTLFSKHPTTHCAALALLPEDFRTGDVRYCLSSTCVFNERRPGHPAHLSVDGGGLCIWCDADLMQKKCASEEGLSRVRQAMTLFKASSDDVYRRAMLLLPAEYRHTGGHYCQADGCPFNTQRPGNPGWCVEGSTYCIWHDASAMDSALESEENRKSLRRSFSLLKQSGAVHDGVSLWEHALQLLPLDFALSARTCANSYCRFLLRRIGEPARSHQTSDLCAWCDTAVLAGRESTAQGRRLIAYSLSKWVARTDVLLAAWCKLSPEFRAAATRQVTWSWENRAMAKHDVVEILRGNAETIEQRRNRSALLSRMPPAHAPHTREHPTWGCTCHLCGQIYLWRTDIKLFEARTRAVEDPISFDLIQGTLGRRGGDLNAARHRSLPCTLCYEARCSHCAGVLQLSDYIWDDMCVHCGKESYPRFVQRSITQPTSIISTSLDSKIGSSGVAYTHHFSYQCCCCGDRGIEGYSRFLYLSWLAYERVEGPPFWDQRDKGLLDREPRPIRRPGYLCGRCRGGTGMVWSYLNRCPWASNTFAWRRTGGTPVYWVCKCRGQTVAQGI